MKPSLPTRRVLGVLFLAIAVIQIILGLSLLQQRLTGLGTLCYWSVCLLATFGAMVCAFLDAARHLGESRRERRQLLHQTLREIDEERARRQTGRENLDANSH